MKNNKGSITKWLFDIPLKYKLLLVLLSLTSMVTAAFSVSFAVSCKAVVDAAVSGNEDAFISSCVLAVLVVVGLLSFNALSRLLKGASEASLEQILRLRFLKRCLKKKYKHLSAYHSGELINRMTADISVVTESLTGICPDVLYYLTQLIYAGVLLFIYIREFMLLIVPVGIVIFLAAAFLRRILKANHTAVRSADGDVRSYAQEIFSSFGVLKAFGAYKKTGENAKKLMNSHKKAKIKQTLLSSLTGVCFSLLMWGGYVAAFVYCGLGILNATSTYGTLVAVQQLINKVQTPFSGLSGVITRIAALEASAQRIMEIEALESDTLANEPGGSIDFARLEVKDLSFSYEDGKKVLSSFDMNVEKGDFACIVGPSGIGKSTVLKLILGLYDGYGGKIRVSDGSGNEIKQKCGVFAYVPQGNYLFTGTVKENIAMFCDDYDDESIINASKIACAHEFICELPNGYDTMIAERGIGLSEGQIQRIAVARAVLTGYPVLLLDESTSALDESIEAKMLENLRSIEGITVVTITHRRAALDVCNKIFRIQP